MSNRIITINEDELHSMIEESVRNILNEYALRNSEYYQKLDGMLIPILNNLLCICIYYDTNPRIIPHWLNRAKQLPTNLFYTVTKSSIGKVIDSAFEDSFGKEYEDIDVESYQLNIEFYDRKNKHDRMTPSRSAEELNNLFTPLVIETLSILKEGLIAKKEGMWRDAVDEFYKKVQTK